jgi:hypothetical protein
MLYYIIFIILYYIPRTINFLLHVQHWPIGVSYEDGNMLTVSGKNITKLLVRYSELEWLKTDGRNGITKYAENSVRLYMWLLAHFDNCPRGEV